MMKEAARRGLDPDFLADAADVEAIERLDRALGLAVDRAEGREIVVSDEMRRALLHRLDVERHGNVPDTARVERGGRAAVEDAVEVAPLDAAEARMPLLGGMFRRKH